VPSGPGSDPDSSAPKSLQYREAVAADPAHDKSGTKDESMYARDGYDGTRVEHDADGHAHYDPANDRSRV
jgi:hypothetical protein